MKLPKISSSDTVIIGLSNGIAIADAIARYLQLERAESETTTFADGEISVTVKETVRNKNVYLVQTTSRPANDNLMELLIAVDMLKRASAKSITAIIPYYGYARQDRKTFGREPISARLVANLLETAGITKAVLLDVHSEQLQGFFNIPVDSLRTQGLLLGEYLKKHPKSKPTIVAPDYGGVQRARRMANVIEAPLAIIDKRRPRPNEVEITNVLGDVKGKDCVLIDDIIDTGKTIIKGAEIIKRNGARSLTILASHGVFSKDSVVNFKQAHKDKLIDSVYICDTIPGAVDKVKGEKMFTVIGVGTFLGEVIAAHENHSSVSSIYNKHTKNFAKFKNR